MYDFTRETALLMTGAWLSMGGAIACFLKAFRSRQWSE
jgi:hypothetical protein